MASQGDIRLQMQGMRIEVKGLSDTLKALDMAGADAQDMRDLMHSTGEIIASAARPLAPVKSGSLVSSLRAGRGKTKAVIRAGTKVRTPYAGVVHYGNPHRGSSASMFLVRAFDQKRDEALSHIEQGLKELLRKNRLI